MLCREEAARPLLWVTFNSRTQKSSHLSQGFTFILLSSGPSTQAQPTLGVLVFPGMGCSLQYGLESQASSAWVRDHNLTVYLDLCLLPEPLDIGQQVRDGSWIRSHPSYLAITCQDAHMAFTGLRAELLELCGQMKTLVRVFNLYVSEVRHGRKVFWAHGVPHSSLGNMRATTQKAQAEANPVVIDRGASGEAWIL